MRASTTKPSRENGDVIDPSTPLPPRAVLEVGGGDPYSMVLIDGHRDEAEYGLLTATTCAMQGPPSTEDRAEGPDAGLAECLGAAPEIMASTAGRSSRDA